MTNVTDSQIQSLQNEAGQAGDSKMVATCERALNGSDRARRECAKVIANAAAMAD